MEIFELQGQLQIDPCKKTLLFVDKGKQDEYTNTYGTARYIKEKIKDQYNIITIGTSCGLTDNYYEFKSGWDKLLRKSDAENYRDINKVEIHKSLEASFNGLPDIDNIILGTDFGYRLPLTAYCNTSLNKELNELKHEYFDYVGTDEKTLHDIEITDKYLVDEWDRLVSPIAFSTKTAHFMNYFIKYLNDNNKLKGSVISFIIDPAFPSFYYKQNNIPLKAYYFEADKRGTRDFLKFPIAQFQHLLYDKKFNNNSLDDWGIEEEVQKTHNLFFAGTLFHDTGFRSTVWPTFLKDVKANKSTYFVPLVRNNFTKKTKKHEDYLSKNRSEIVDEVTSHQNFKEGIPPLELYKQIAKYKYGIVFRCVSHYDSLNFKPVFYVSENILPLLDEQYDPSFLQIPKRIQKHLVVHNSAEIDERIEFFNSNPEKRNEILAELRELFKIDQFINNENDIINHEITNILEG